MNNLIKTSAGKLIKYVPLYITCNAFTTTKPLPMTSHSTLSGITITPQYKGYPVIITNGDEVCTYRFNSEDNTFTPNGSPSLVKKDAIYIVNDQGLSPNYVGKYYLRSTATWSDTPPATKLIKIN